VKTRKNMWSRHSLCQEDFSSVDRQGSRGTKSKGSCALQHVTTELGEVSSDEERRISVEAEQSRTERLGLCQFS
jgi:hypothetical protein